MLPVLDDGVQRAEIVEGWNVHTLALFAGLDDLGGDAIGVDFAVFGAGGYDWLEVRDAELDRFFDDEIHAVFGEGREEKVRAADEFWLRGDFFLRG